MNDFTNLRNGILECFAVMAIMIIWICCLSSEVGELEDRVKKLEDKKNENELD
jgi:hypothetical protein